MAFYLGVDGGGSKTAAVITDDTLRVVGRGEAGGSNYHVVGEETAIENIELAVSGARQGSNATDLAAAAVCLAGMRRPPDFERMRPRIEALGLSASLVIDHDAAAAQHGALGGRPGVVVIAGTGSFAFGIDVEGRRSSSGGWGYLLGDEGGGYWCIVTALKLALRRHDRDEQSCEVGKTIIRELQCGDLMSAVDRIYHGGLSRDQIAAIAPEIFRLAEKREPDADWLVQEAARELASMAADVSRRCQNGDEPVAVSYQGSLLREWGVLRKSFETWMGFLAPGAKVSPPIHEPVVGAAGVARSLLTSRG